jgi:hypothetical protein
MDSSLASLWEIAVSFRPSLLLVFGMTLPRNSETESLFGVVFRLDVSFLFVK